MGSLRGADWVVILSYLITFFLSSLLLLVLVLVLVSLLSVYSLIYIYNQIGHFDDPSQNNYGTAKHENENEQA